MVRYIGFAWNPDSAEQTLIAQQAGVRLRRSPSQWHGTIDVPGLAVYVARSGEHIANLVLERQSGVVLGGIFSRDGYRSQQETNNRVQIETDAIVASDAKRLIHQYWGSYVAVVRDGQAKTTWILRSPMAAIACLTAEFRGVHFFFSRSQDLAALDLMPLSVNWDYIAVHVALGTARGDETGVREIREIKPGAYVRIGPSDATYGSYWHPCDAQADGMIEDFPDAARQVRVTAMACVHAWASHHSRIVHRLSGGLDSSVVAACLRAAPTQPSVVCLNEYSPGADGDERPFARLVAERTGYDLEEHRRNPETKLEGMLNACQIANPQCGFMDYTLGRYSVELARRESASALFDGTLGDVIFHRQPVTAATADFVYYQGLKPALLSTALDVAAMDRLSLWRTLRHAIRDAWLTPRRGTDLWWRMFRQALARAAEIRSTDLVNRHVMEPLLTGDRFVHPWFRGERKLAPGAAWQLFGMSFNSIEDPYAMPRDPEKVHPLMSQPLVELCLRFPTYVHLSGGWDRAIARRAFSNDLPLQIIERTTKGGLEDHAKVVIVRNIDFVRDILLHGALVREKLIDRKKLESALSSDPAKDSALPSDILTHLDTELWLKAWSGRRLSAAA